MSFLVFAPAIYGMLVAYGGAGRLRLPVSLHLTILGSAPFIGYLSLALLTRACEFLGFSWRSEIFVISHFVVLLTACLVGHTIQKKKISSSNNDPRIEKGKYLKIGFGAFLSCWLLLIIAFVSHESLSRPLSAWDAINYWAPHSEAILQSQLNNLSGYSPDIYHRHPDAIKIIGAYSTLTQELSPKAVSVRNAPWLMLYLGIILFTAGICLRLTQSTILALSSSILVASLPIIESHTALAGYADIWLASGVLICAGMTILAIHAQRVELLITAALLSIALMFIKSFGIALSALMTSLALYAWMTNPALRDAGPSGVSLFRAAIPFLIGSTLVASFIALMLKSDPYLDGNSPIQSNFLEHNLLGFLSHSLGALRMILDAAVTSTSFNILLMSSLLTIFYFFLAYSSQRASWRPTLSIFFVTFFWIPVSTLLMFSEFLQIHSTIDNDTAITRALITIAPAQLLMALHSISELRRPRNDSN